MMAMDGNAVACVGDSAVSRECLRVAAVQNMSVAGRAQEREWGQNVGVVGWWSGVVVV